MDCVIYIRWSSAEQSKGSSLDRQRDDCRRHAAAKNWKVVSELIDDGVSAYSGRHAAEGRLGDFIADVEAGRYPAGVVLLAEKLDRLSRQHAKTVFSWMLRMTEAGVVIATVDGDRHYERDNLDMASIIEVVVKAQLSHEESAKKSHRLAAAWAAKRGKLDRGERLVMTRRAPAWLRVAGSPPAFELIEDRAVIVQRIFADTAAGLGKHHIARNLNQERVPAFGRGAGWHASYIQKILHSRAVLGEFQPGRKARGEARTLVGEPIPDYYPRVVDADLHARATRGMAGRSRLVMGRGRRLANLFSGLAVCNVCGAKMTFRGKGAKRRADGTMVNEDYLICDSYQRGRGCTNGRHFNYAFAENAIFDAILEETLDDRHFVMPDQIRQLERAVAEQRLALQSALALAETALDIAIKSNREEARARWMQHAESADVLRVSVDQAEEELTYSRGAVPPDEHLRRIEALRFECSSDDETIRFEARSKVMRAIHEVVERMSFNDHPDEIEINSKIGFNALVHMDGRGAADHQFWFDEQPGAKTG